MLKKRRTVSILLVCLMAILTLCASISVYADDETYVATVTSNGETASYTSFADAVNAATSGSTVTLLTDASITSTLYVTKELTIDLNNYTLTIESGSYTSNVAVNVAYYSSYEESLTVKNGTITDKRSYGNTSYNNYTFYVVGEAVLTLQDVTVQAYQPNVYIASNTLIYAAAYSTTQCPVINLESGAVLTELTNTSSSAYYWVNGVILMGYESSTYESLIDGDGSTLNIKDGAKISVSGYCISGNANYPGTTINITGGTLNSTYDLAIYHPQNGTLNISGGSITAHDGYSAIEMRAGTLNVTGGSIIADASEFFTYKNSGGSSVYGAAIAVSQHTTKQAISVYITGDDTVITGYYALYEANVMGNASDSIAKVTIHIDDGTFKSTGTDKPAVYSEDCEDFICHGTFISSIDEDISDTYLDEEPCKGGTIVVITADGQTDVHSITAVDAKEATCLEDGIRACYVCTYCGAYFTVTTETDDDGNESIVYTEVEESDVVISATGHDYDYANGEWTWTETDDGYTATYTVICKNDSSHTLVFEATVTSEVTEATCTTGGYTTYTATVTVDGTEYTDSKQGNTIEATGHTESEAVQENVVDATCETGGSYDSVVYCSVCGAEISRETVTTEATGHDYDYNNGEWTWTETDDGYTVTFTVTCTACGAIYEIEATVTSTTLDDGSVVYTAVAVDDDGNAYSDTLTISVEEDAEDDDSVQTSDSSNIALMGIILLAAIAGCAGVAVSKRR